MTKKMKVVIDFVTRTKQLDKAFNKINKQRQYLDEGMRLSNKGYITDLGTQQRLNNRIGAERLVNHQREMKHAKEMRGVMLGRNLSWMFFGMMIQRVMGGVLRSLANTYQTATQGNTGLGKATTRLSASWEFLKFTIMNALDNPGFIKFIDFITGAIQSVGDWVSENEWAAYTILGVFTAAFTFGAGLMIFGQFALAWYSTTAWMASTTAGGGLAVFAAGGAARLAFSSFISAINALAIFTLLYKGIDEFSEGKFGSGLMKWIAAGAIWKHGAKGLGLYVSWWLAFKGLSGGFGEKFQEGALAGFTAGLPAAGTIASTGVGLLPAGFTLAGTTIIGGLWNSIFGASEEEANKEIAGIQDAADDLNNSTTCLNAAYGGENSGLNQSMSNLNSTIATGSEAMANYNSFAWDMHDAINATDDAVAGQSLYPNMVLLNTTLKKSSGEVLPTFNKSMWESRIQIMATDESVKNLIESLNAMPTEKHIYIYTHHISIGDSSTD